MSEQSGIMVDKKVPPHRASDRGRGHIQVHGGDMTSVTSPPATETKPRKWSIPSQYKGIRMRSKLEVWYAQFFDQHRIQWAYEPQGFDLSGIKYLPDFHLPEIKTILEVKGVMESYDAAKLGALAPVAAKHGMLTIIGWPAPPARFQLCHPTPEMEAKAQIDPTYTAVCAWEFNPDDDINDDAALVRCATCQRWYFIDTSMSWQCISCGAYDGNMTFDLVHPGSPGWATHDCPDCGECGE